MSEQITYPIKEIKLDSWTKKVNCMSMFTIPAEDEALPVLRQFEQIMTKLLTLPISDTLDQTCIEYFFVKVVPVVCQKLIRSRYFKSNVVLKLANSFLQNSIYLVQRYLDIGIKYPKFLEVLPIVFCTDQYYFKSNDQLSYYHYPYSYFVNKNKIGFQVKVDDIIDIMKIDNVFDKATWSQGRVTQIYEYQIQVAFLYDWSDKITRVRKQSSQIAPFKSCSEKNMQWRFSLKKGDLIDCEDTYGNWFNATITDVIQGQENKRKIKYLFRVYHPKGNRTDQKQNTYFGSLLDEQHQIDFTSPKIAPYCSIAKQYSYQSNKTSFDIIDDINDFEFSVINGQKVYALPRKKYLSSLLFETINGFGRAGGFDKIISYLQKEINYDIFCHFSKALSGICGFLHRKFIHEIIGRLKDLVQHYIFSNPEKMSKQFTKQKSSMIFSGVRALQKRIYSNDTVYKFQNQIKMRLVESCLEDKLTQKLQGLNQLKDIVKNGNYVTQKNRQIKSWIKDHKIFDKIYITNSHAQLIKKSEDFFKYLVTQSILEVHDLERLYKIAQKSDFETRISLYKLFQEVAYLFKKNHVEFVIDTILQSELSLIRNQDIDLLHELSRFSNYFPLDKVINFFENIILSDNPNKLPELNDYAIKKYSDIVVRNHDIKPRRRSIIRNFLQKMPTHNISQITKVLKGIFQGIGIGEWGKRDLFDILSDQKIDQVCIETLKRCKQNSAINFEYIFKQVLAFLLSIYKLSYKIKIYAINLSKIWDIAVENQQLQRSYFKWLTQQFDKCEQGIQSEDSTQFQAFYQKIFNKDRIKKMGGLQFEVAKNLFIEINKKSKLLSVTSCLRNNVTEKQYKRKVQIRGLKLIDVLFEMIFDVGSSDISQKLLLFFVQMYNSKQNSQIQIEGFLVQLLADFKKLYSQKRYNQVSKVIKLLDVVINDSQKHCDANIQSLRKRKNKRDKVKFMIINQIYYSSDTVKKIDMFLDTNITVMDLRKKLAKQYDANWNEIRITSSRQIPDHQNSKTLQQIKINPNTPITVTKRITYSSQPDADLMMGHQMNPLAVRCFKKIFQRYSTDGKMNKDQCNSFTTICLGSGSSKRHYTQKINSFYAKYDDDKDDLLTFQNFLAFYIDAATDRPITVWSNLRSFGVKGNFRFKDEPDEDPKQITQFPRAQMSKSDQFYKILFQLLKIKQCASLAYELLQRLPVYKQIENKILNISSQADINSVLNCQGQYQLYYKLNIIQYLVNSDQLKTQSQKNFHSIFIQKHGYEQLYELSKKIMITVVSLKKLSVQTDSLTYYEDNDRIDINEYILYTILSLLKRFWLQSQIFTTEQQTKKVQQSISLLNCEYDLNEKIQYLITGSFPKPQQKLVINEYNHNSFNLEQYTWNSQNAQEICKNILNRLIQLWLCYKKTSEIQTCTHNPTVKENITNILYIQSSLITKTIQILNIMYLNRKQIASTFIKQLLYLLEQASPSKLSVQVYCLILCQSFYSEHGSGIQSIYIQQLFRTLTKGNIISSEHFLVLAVLVSKFGISEGQQKKQQIQKMRQILLDNVLNNTNEPTIQGCAQLLCNFKLDNLEYQTFQKLWETRLFNPQTIITREQSKGMLYQLILKICEYNPKMIDQIIKRVMKTIQQKSPQMKITYCNQYKQRSMTKYAGLKNLGNICYMNSMLQQIYMNNIFRYILLRINDHKQHTMTEFFDDKQQKLKIVDDNLLHQTQKIFAYLNNTTRIDYAPKDFCRAYKPFGEPVNIMIQQDVQEFVSMFFDRLQSFIKDTPFKNIVQQFYSGKTANIFQCRSCHKAKKVQQNFHCLTLEIKNAKNLSQSFVRFTTGEQISDYTCDFCQKKVDVEKKTVVSKAPKVLLIHLQRIIFNLDTFINQKLSTKHSFPTNFNLYPYTLQNIEKQAQKSAQQKDTNINQKSSQQQSQQQNLMPFQKQQQKVDLSKQTNPQDNYEYQLAGIVCHSGHAEAGHYISYIKTSDNKWLQFNDSLVTYFNPANIQSECFGGVFATTTSYDDDYDWDNKKQSSKCAYMVIYQRKQSKQEDTLLRVVLNQQQSKQQFLKKYDLTEVIQKLQINQKQNDKANSNLKNKNKDNESSGIQTGDNMTNDFNQNQSQQDSSDMPEDSQKQAKQLLQAKQLEIKRHQSEDNVQTQMIQDKKQIKKQSKQKQILINLKNLTPYQSPQLFQQVNRDNTIHFYEKSLSSEHFSKFFAQLLSKPHTLQNQMLPICQKLTFGFWLKSPSFKDLLHMLDKMIQGSTQGVEAVITQNKSVISLLIESSDSQVRTNMAAFLSKAVTDIVANKPNINILDETQPVIKFLDNLLSLLPTTVTKCWTKFSQYFQFWYQIAKKQFKIVQYMLKKEIIKHFMDYFMDAKSPLKIYHTKKANQIGSSYASPNFSFLLKCVSCLLQYKLTSSEVQKLELHKLSSEQQILLISCESLQKLINDNYEFVATQLVKSICPNNLYASEKVALVILKGISKSNYETIQPYLQVLHQYTLIQDEYQDLRMKWVLGKKTLAVSTYTKKIIAINSYTVDQRIYNYDSALFIESTASLLDYLFIYYKKMQNFSMLCLRKLLRLCQISKKIRDYIFSLESPTLTMNKYVDFFSQFINRVIGYSGYYSVTFNKEELGKQIKVIYENVLDIINKENKKQQNNIQQQLQKQKNAQQTEIQVKQIIEEEVTNYVQLANQKPKQKQQQISQTQNSQSKQDTNKQDYVHADAEHCEPQVVQYKEVVQTYQVNQDVQKKSDDNFSFNKGSSSNNISERDSFNSWDQQQQQYPSLGRYYNTPDELEQQNKKNKNKKKQYQIKVIYSQEEKNKHSGDQQVDFQAVEFSSDQDQPLISKDPVQKSSGKDYIPTYHPIIFQYRPVKQNCVPTLWEESLKQSQKQISYERDVKITYHQSEVVYALTKPTGTSNKSIQMSVAGQKVVDRLLPEVMQNTKKQIVSGFYVRNESKQWIRIMTDDGCTYCKSLESTWVWCKDIKKVWYSERCMDFPKWSLFKRENQK